MLNKKMCKNPMHGRSITIFSDTIRPLLIEIDDDASCLLLYYTSAAASDLL